MELDRKNNFLLSQISEVVHYLLLKHRNDFLFLESNDQKHFDETRYYFTNINNYRHINPLFFTQIPQKINIFEFLDQFCFIANLNENEILYGFIYIMSLYFKKKILLKPSNWRLFFISSLCLANKFLNENQSISEYTANIYPFLSNKQFKDLEKILLQIIDYKLFVSFRQFITYKSNLFCLKNNKRNKRSKTL